MELEQAQAIWKCIDGSNCDADRDLAELKRDLVDRAVIYARIRTDYQLADAESRRDIDSSRTHAHDDFINSCDILGRNMGKRDQDDSWLGMLGTDRKDKGDFACFIHCFLGLQAR